MMEREIRVLLDRSRDPAENLVREDELLRSVERGETAELVRFWVNLPCLVKGKARNPRYGWYDEALARKLGVPVFERSTGGGVVYNDEGNLNWSFFLKTSGAFLSPTKAFEEGSKYIIRTLERLGVRAHFSPPNRIDVEGRKVSGMAARSTPRTLLVHGTLLLNSDLRRLNLLCIPPPGCPPVSNLSEWVKGVEASSVIETFIKVLEDSGIEARMEEQPR